MGWRSVVMLNVRNVTDFVNQYLQSDDWQSWGKHGGRENRWRMQDTQRHGLEGGEWINRPDWWGEWDGNEEQIWRWRGKCWERDRKTQREREREELGSAYVLKLSCETCPRGCECEWLGQQQLENVCMLCELLSHALSLSLSRGSVAMHYWSCWFVCIKRIQGYTDMDVAALQQSYSGSMYTSHFQVLHSQSQHRVNLLSGAWCVSVLKF